MATLYVFVRTSIALSASADQIAPLEFALSPYSVEVFSFGPDDWRDGAAFRFHTKDRPDVVSDRIHDIAPGLEWHAVHDMRRALVTCPSLGDSEFFKALGSKAVSQLLLRFDRDNPHNERLIEKLKVELSRNGGRVENHGYFRNGLAMLVARNEPTKTTFRRCEGILHSRIDWRFIDDAETTLGPFGEARGAWRSLTRRSGRRRG
jgi:hypothetical protein